MDGLEKVVEAEGGNKKQVYETNDRDARDDEVMCRTERGEDV